MNIYIHCFLFCSDTLHPLLRSFRSGSGIFVAHCSALSVIADRPIVPFNLPCLCIKLNHFESE